MEPGEHLEALENILTAVQVLFCLFILRFNPLSTNATYGESQFDFEIVIFYPNRRKCAEAEKNSKLVFSEIFG